jgi:hypothetical protein
MQVGSYEKESILIVRVFMENTTFVKAQNGCGKYLDLFFFVWKIKKVDSYRS